MSAALPIKIETETLRKASKFIEDLQQEEKDMAYAMIRALECFPHEDGLVKIVDKRNRIFEARGSTKDFWIRHFWFYHKIPNEGRSKIVITNSCIKKQNKTDPNEIDIAVRMQSMYEALKKEEYKKLSKGKK